MAEEKKAKKKRPTAKKRDMQNEKRRLVNRSFKSKFKTVARSFEKDVQEKNTEALTSGLNTLYSLVDKEVKRGILKLNKANRIKQKYSNTSYQK